MLDAQLKAAIAVAVTPSLMRKERRLQAVGATTVNATTKSTKGRL